MSANDRASNPSLCLHFTWAGSEVVSIDCHCPSCRTGVPDEEEPVLIAVIGTSGSGKTSFVNMASGSPVRLRNDFGLGDTAVRHSRQFVVDARQVVLIVMPPLDDLESDGEVFEMIAAFLKTSGHSALGGLLYFRRISDPLVTGASLRDFEVLRKLCGKSTLQNFVIVSCTWDGASWGVGEAREGEPVAGFFKLALDDGAQLVRYDNDVRSSAHDIIRLVTRNPELNEPTRRHRSELQAVREEVIKVLRDQEDVLRGEFEQEILQRGFEQGTLQGELEQEVHKIREQTRAELEREILKVQEQARLESEQEIRRVKEQMRAELEQEIHNAREQGRVESERAIRKVREDTRNRGGELFPP